MPRTWWEKNGVEEPGWARQERLRRNKLAREARARRAAKGLGKRTIYARFEDNRGNPVQVAACEDGPDNHRAGPRCKHPCVIISGRNVHMNTPTGHAIHLTEDGARAVLAALDAFLSDAHSQRPGEK